MYLCCAAGDIYVPEQCTYVAPANVVLLVFNDCVLHVNKPLLNW